MAYPDPDPLVGFRHHRLPMPTLEALADYVDSGGDPRPDRDLIAAVHAAVARIQSKGGEHDSPYWVHAETHQARRDVTIGQVAWVLVNHPTR